MNARRERKVVTCLFADLVGFTSRAESLDPEDVEAILRPYHERLRGELERHGGTVEKFIGDAVMALFGAPAAHEDDPERAVRAALAIRDWARDDGELEVRIGVTTGEALVRVDANPERGEGMASGDVVNTASRLQSAAPTNGVLVDESTYRATRAVIDYGDARDVEAKGKSEPIRAWEPLEAKARFGVDIVRAGAPLVGRRRELDLLADALTRARDERTPQLVTLVGVPGIGKSRLVYELSRIVDAEPELVNWRQGRSLPYGEGVTFWALSEMVKAQAGVLESDPPAEAERKLAEAAAMLGLEDEATLESLRPLLGLGAESGGGRSEHFAAWRRFLEALAEQHPTVLVFEDLHWADDDLLDFVDYLVDWGAGVPLLVTCTARPELLERRPGWGGGKANALTLSLSPLSDDDTARLISSLLERAVLPAEVQAALLGRAGGNPLYAEQFARLLDEADDLDGLPLPENVHGIIAARLDGLAVEEKRLLQDAAVLGKVFWIGAVCAVGGRTREQAEAALHALVRKEFVRRERRSSVAGEDELAFRHLLVRDVAYGQIPRAERAARHEHAARWIESLSRPEDVGEMLAHHYLEAIRLGRDAGVEPSDDLIERARRAARDAGDRALALGAHTQATRFYEAAIELSPPDDPGRPDLLLAYARSRVDDVALDDAVLEQATEGLLAAGRIEAAAEAQARLGGIWLNRGDPERARRHLDRGRELVEERKASPAKAFVLQELGRTTMMADELDEAIEFASESLRLAESLGLEATRARNLNTIGVARVINGDRDGLGDLERAMEIGAAVHSAEEVSALANLAWMTAVTGELRTAGELQERCLDMSRRMGVSGFVHWQQAERVFHCHWQGRWDEALATADDFIVTHGGGHYMESSCRMIRASIKLARNDRDGALEDASRGTEGARVVRDPQTLIPSIALEARVRVSVGDRAGAATLADELVDAWGGTPVRAPHECGDAPWVFIDLGREDELKTALENVKGRMLWHDAAQQVIAGQLVEAAETFHRIGSVPDEAYTRVRAAAERVAAGDRLEADRQLRLALPVLAQLRATAWQAEAEALLARTA